MNDSEGKIGLKHPKVPGDFPGHALPGVFFFIMGLWWSTKSILKYVCKRHKRTCYLGSQALFQRLEMLEGIVIVGMTLIGIIGVRFFAGGPHLIIQKESLWSRLLRWHHFNLYFFFGLLGVANILCSTISSLPVSLTKLMMSNAFLVEAFIFYNHTHGREMLDVFVHQILTLVSFLTGLMAFIEFLIRKNVLLELLRSSFVLLQGSWFWQIGFVLFPPGGGPAWNLLEHDNVTFLTVCFCWHYALAYIVIGANYAFITWLVKSRLKKLGPSEVGLLKNVEGEQESEEEM
ncbi:transmembrane protein 45A-like [Sciurus carolinensis]|uniref:transmembrane protein 45A-like n=1 Tax=Sciurus carolinensis TaxID=30640 RepID=UPI001FB1C786|nr:transmembrane protein 45A-like [Sciurus carolinensis]XP_047420709.1 transmembrane protein 45A-like [Sciurus carolinensis]